MAKLRDAAVAICGAGALGANLTESLARSGFETLKIIDRDRVEERNLSTQPYYRADVGAYKAKMLANALYRAIGVRITAETKELTAANAEPLLRNSRLVVDMFDNSIARQAVKDACQAVNVPCLHVGLASDYAEVIWEPFYRVPSPTNDDVCDYPLARNLVLLAVAVASEAIVTFVATGKMQHYTITLKDLSVRSLDLQSQ